MTRTVALQWVSLILQWFVVLGLSSSIVIVPHCRNAGVLHSASCLQRTENVRNPRCSTTRTVRLSSKSNDDNEEEFLEEESSFDLGEFLDRPFFEPDKVLEDESSNPLLKRLASFVVDDYAKAEAMLSAMFFVVLIVFAQEALRMQLYGGNYEPFSRGVLPGNLF